MDASILGRTDAEILAWESYVLEFSYRDGVSSVRLAAGD
jgi:hypothetical protein